MELWLNKGQKFTIKQMQQYQQTNTSLKAITKNYKNKHVHTHIYACT